MKKIVLILVAVAGFFITACSNKGVPEQDGREEAEAVDLSNDSTRYGIACEGCTDSVIYFLPENCGDPIRYDILDARLGHRVFGHPRIGDNIAILVNPQDTSEVTFLVDLDDLMSTWCYQVMPKMRDYEKMSKKMQSRIMKDMPDSIKQSYLIPREYGFTLKTHFVAAPVGMVRQGSALEEESPVVYPVLPFYRQWHLLNGKLILSRMLMPVAVNKENKENKEDKEKKENKESNGVEMRFENDTTDLVFMGPDSLVLQFKDHVQSYYRLGDAADANKVAREKAQKLAKDAQDQIKK